MDQTVLTLPLKMLKIIGLGPYCNSPIDYIKSAVVFIAAVITMFTTSIQIYYSEWNIVAIAPPMETLMTTQLCVARWFVLFLFKKHISQLITESKTLWRIPDVDPNEETGAEATVQFILKWYTIFSLIVFTTCTVPFILTAIFTWGQALPFETWFPEDFTYGYQICYINQAVFIFTTMCSVLGGDGLFAAFCGQLIAQFKILNRKLENTVQIKTTAVFLKNLEECIEYHVKLLNFGEKLSKVFVTLLLMQYLNTVATSCIELFLAAEKLDDIALVLRSAFAAGSLMAQMGIYCFLAEAVIDESTNTALAVYSSDWHSRDLKKVGVHVQMIIMRASKPITFSGGGLFVIGRILWFDMCKFSVSLFTLLSSLK